MSPTVVQQVTFSGPRSVPRGRLVPFVTERCVFRLCPPSASLGQFDVIA